MFLINMKNFLYYILPAIILTGCSSIENKPLVDGFIGSPEKHGFVVLEGESLLRGTEIQAITLENTQYPEKFIHGESRMNSTWISILEPGEYRIKKIRFVADTQEYSNVSDNDIASDPNLTFSIKAGELLYFGLIEFQAEIVEMLDSSGNVIGFTSHYIGSNIINNRDEFRVWESLYDDYSKTPWEPLLLNKLNKLNEQKISHPVASQ